jgi:hypothetical protein
MEKLEKLRLHDLNEICVDEQRSIKGGGYWTTIDGQEVYVLDEVVVEDGHDPINWACSNEHGVIVAGFVLEGPDGSGGLFGAGKHFGHLQEEDKQALINIGASILGFALKITEPIIVGAEYLWKPYFNHVNGSDVIMTLTQEGGKKPENPNEELEF